MSCAINLAAAAATGAALSSCAARQQPAGENPAIIVLSGAQELQSAESYDGQVGYKLRDPYPGQRTIEEVRRRLKEQGWQPRDRDLLNPTLTRKITARWRQLQTADGDVLAWSEQWENDDGDIVMYGFSYAVSAGGRDPARDIPMEVLISYFRAEAAKRLKREGAKNSGTVQK